MVGELITWHNSDGVPHTAVSGNSGHPDGVFNTGIIDSGADSPVVTVHHPGDIAYFCQIHPYLIGRLHAQ